MKILNTIFLLFIVIGCANKQQNIEIDRDRHREVPENIFVENNEEPLKLEGNNEEIESTIVGNSYQNKKQVELIPSFDENQIKDFKISANNIKKPTILVQGKDVKVNIESIPLNEFIDFIFSSVLKLNYSVDKEVKALKQPINLNMSEALSKQALFNVVEKILKKESVTLTKNNGTIFISLSSSQKIKDDLSNKYIFFGRKIPAHIEDDKKVIVFVPYYYSSPKNSFNVLKRLGAGNVHFAYLKGNIQILEGKARDVRQTLEMISVIDSLGIENKSPYLIELENIKVEKFKNELVNIFKSNAIPIATSINETGIVLTEIKELNGLLILTPKQSWLDRVLFWKNKLDVLSEVDTQNSQFYIYKVKYRKVDEFAKILSSVLNIEIPIRSNENNQSQENLKQSSNSVKIKSDLMTNTLMLNVTPAQYKKILPIIKKLDIRPLQVAVEVTLAEVTMKDNFSLGFEWGLLNNKARLGTPLKVNSGAYNLSLSGGGIVSNLLTTNLTSVINALAEKKKLNILSRPRLVILNNKVGTINIGQEIPVLGSETTSTGGQGSLVPVQNISYVSTGMTLNLTPTINSNGSLTMDVDITLSEASSNKDSGLSGIDSPLIVNRSLTTSAVMQSGNSIFLGGMISHNKSSSNNGVPGLKDIPLIGNLFKSQSEGNVKTELIILIKPKILKNNLESYEETQKFKIILKSLREIIEL